MKLDGSMKHNPGPLLPAEFRGCIWDDGWEYDAPCVIYYPPQYARFDAGGNSHTMESMVEDIVADIADGREHSDGGIDRECEWRGWGRHGFARRKRAEHVVIRVAWNWNEQYQEWEPEIVSVECFIGPPKDGRRV